MDKTRIRQLPRPLDEDWLTALRLSLPSEPQLNAHVALAYIDRAVELADRRPDGSVLKYALKAVSKRLSAAAKLDVLRYAVALCFHQPVLLPLLRNILPPKQWPRVFVDELKELVRENARYRRSDAMVWGQYYLHELGTTLDRTASKAVYESQDCMSLLLLFLYGTRSHRQSVVRFAGGLDPDDVYRLDEHWLLLYELYRRGKIQNPYPYNDGTFDTMKTAGVSFLT